MGKSAESRAMPMLLTSNFLFQSTEELVKSREVSRSLENMSNGSGTVRRLVASIRSSSFDHVCLSCRLRTRPPSRRTYASAATAQATVETPPVTQLTPPGPQSSPLQQLKYKIKAGVLLSRAPLITPDPHPFETAYYLYQRRLNERLVLPFTQYFYYKRGTPAFEHWRTYRQKRAGTATRDIGPYDAYGKEGWNDEVLVNDDSGDRDKLVKSLLEEEGRPGHVVGEKVEDGQIGQEDFRVAGLTRQTEADQRGILRSLERNLSRTLYLVVKRSGQGEEKQRWGFPSAEITGKEGLKEGATRILHEGCGVNMNTWFVGSHPVGHYISDYDHRDEQSKKTLQQEQDKENGADPTSLAGEKTFFMKARIFAGQADLGVAGSEGWEDFRWLTKDEIQYLVPWHYWVKTRNMLVDQ